MKSLAALLTILLLTGFGASATELGVAYEPRTGDELRADLDAMREAGITAVITGDTPYASEWPVLTEFLTEARARGMKVAIITVTDWFPEKQYDGVSSAAVKPDGSKGLPYSYACEPAQRDIADAVAAFVRKFRLYNNVIHFNLVNEVWAFEDHSSWAEQGFRSYLQELHPDIAHWNKRWGTDFAGFADIRLDNVPATGVFRNDFDIYRSDAYARFYQNIYRKVRSAVPPSCSISAQKLYADYFSNHSTCSREACLDFRKLFQEHLCNEAWSCHEYGWGSVAVKMSKVRTVNGVWRRPIMVTEAWGCATDDKKEAQRHWEETLSVLRMSKVVYDPDFVFIYQWRWLSDKPEWRRQLKEEIVPLLKEELGIPMFDEVGILDARVAHYEFDPGTEESYVNLNEAASEAGLLPIEVYTDESQTYSLGKAVFDTQPTFLMIPMDRGLYPDSLFADYPGTVMRYGKGKPSPAAIREAAERAGVKPLIAEFSKPAGVYEQIYRDGDGLTLAVYNSTDKPAKVSYTIRLPKSTTAKASFMPVYNYANVWVAAKLGKTGGTVEAEIPPHGAGLYRL